MTRELYSDIKEYCIQLLSNYYQGKRISEEDAKIIKKTGKMNRSLFSKDKADGEAKRVVKEHLIPDVLKSAKDIYRRLLISGQNRNMMPNVIKFTEREEQFKAIFCDFDYKKVANTIPTNLLKKFKKTFNLDENKVKAKGTHPSLWEQYAEFAVSAAKFMQRMSGDYGVDTFKNHISQRKGELSEPEFVDKNVTGIGYTLACDFLKEIGYDMAKPDLHILAFLKEFYGKSFSEKDAIEKIKELSATVTDKFENNVYALDKLIWLCCTGNYYKENIKIKPLSLRDEFLDSLSKEI